MQNPEAALQLTASCYSFALRMHLAATIAKQLLLTLGSSHYRTVL